MSANSFTVALLWLAVTVSAPAAPNIGRTAGSKSDKPANSEVAKTPSIQMKLFTDRASVRKDETIKVSVWVESKSADPIELQIFFPNQLFTLEGESTRLVTFASDQPTPLPITFALKAKSAGKSNIMVSASGTDKESKERLSAVQQLQGVEVQEGTYSLKTLASNPLAGVFVGALLTFLATHLNDLRQRRKDRTDKRQWLTDTLPAQLQGAALAVTKEQETDFDPLTSKLSTEGYLTELRRLDKKNGDLITRLMSLNQDLSVYEEARSNERLDDTVRDELAKKLNLLAQELRELG